MTGRFRLWNRSRAPDTTTVEAVEPSSIQKSLALNVLFHQFKEERKHLILDLGPPIGQNVEFFSEYRCRLHIEDLFEALNSFDFLAPEDGFSYETVFSYLLPFRPDLRFDFILTWDLFNYLEKDAFRHLIRHLSKHVHRGSFMYSLISTNRHIPETPHQFKILDRENLMYIRQSSVLKACPRYEATDLHQLMPHFRVFNSFHLRNGYREYLFAYE